MNRAALFLVSSLIVLTAQAADPPKAPIEAERMLLGGWKGPACGGDWTYAADGTFEAVHFSPGGNRLTGTWGVRWNAIPLTFMRTCTASDDPDLVGKTWEVKLVQLDAETLAYQYRDQFPHGHVVRYRRSPDVLGGAGLQQRELAALQGTWVPMHYEEGGVQAKDVPTRHVIKGNTVTVQVDGKTHAEGKVVVDVTQSPKRLEYRLTSGQTHVMIYVRAGDSVIYCGNRDGKTYPSEFASGTANGGEYLIAWKIER